MINGLGEYKKSEEELLLLQKINNMLNSGISQEKVFKEIVEGLRSLYGYDPVAIHILSKDQKHLIIKSIAADSNIVHKFEKLTGVSILGYKARLYEGGLLEEIVETKKPVVTDDIVEVLKSYTDNKSLHAMAEVVAKLTDAKWGLGVPLLAGDKVIGTIGCGSKEIPSISDTLGLAKFADQAGLAIEKGQTYEQLEYAYKELKHSNRLKDLFIDIMRHDLFNPAGAVKNLADLILMDEEDPDKQEELELILYNANNIIDMIENASKLAMLESGEKLKFKNDNLGDILKGAVNDLTLQAEKKNTKIIVEVNGEFIARVSPLIYDVFLNLIDNAIKYGPEDSNINVSINQQNHSYSISVADRGEGIPDEFKESIFTRFKRVHKGGVKGTGLGLAIVKKVMDAHKGKVLVEDNPEGGTIIKVLLPKD